MEFQLTTSKMTYAEEDCAKYEKLGFVFDKTDAGGCFTICEPLVEFTTLEQLKKFADEWGPLVLTDNTIEIYDGYRE